VQSEADLHFSQVARRSVLQVDRQIQSSGLLLRAVATLRGRRLRPGIRAAPAGAGVVPARDAGGR
jgi:hypothetical protein